ncbi:MmpS family transport accessory protein [Mycolicibacterium arenosum]|uniref:MmpS family transport accessory protein n=1 Tax=Mycolicibacterium arenosum TaxID=2952157 RepID=A0ABT1MBA6_9MYCO|nr:MmpS family transport accessory protein [Mycolicibacterium sp. CAU 1645]MCP9276433.1 MmpS family transport accessory protein [Mycolicibacterium sp. CAU 1645]
MSGPNPPEQDAPTPDDEPAQESPATGETDVYSRAYSAPESEHFTSGPYVPSAEVALYEYDDYADGDQPPKWPWVVGVVAIVAAIALVASVAVLVTRSDNTSVATPSTSSTTPGAPIQDEITTTTPPPPPPPTTTVEPPPPPPPPPVTTEEPPPPPPPSTEAPPPAPPETPAPPPPSAPAGPRFITYTVTGTKAPLDRISVTYTDASGRQRTQQNVYIPWSLTVTPISMSEYGSVQASSLLRLSKLNCSITTSDGQTIASQQNNDWQTSC